MPRQRTGSKRGNGEGTVFQRKDGRWVAKLTLHNGARKEFYYRTREGVVQKMEEAKSAIRSGRTLPSERVTVSGYAKIWLNLKRESTRHKTYSGWEGLIRLHVLPHIGHLPIARIRPVHLQELYADLGNKGLSSTSVNSVHRVLKNMLRTAERTDVVPRCVADLVQAPSMNRREMIVLSAEQARAFLRVSCGHRLESLFELALMSGARISELLAIRWQDVSFERKVLSIRQAMQVTANGIAPGNPKTKAGIRDIPLDDAMFESIKNHRVKMAEEALAMGAPWNNELDLVFVSNAGTPLSVSNIRRRDFKPLSKRANLPAKLRLHDLRHFFASYNLSRGVPVTVVSKVMGHSSPAVTHSIYAHCIPGDERSIATTMSELRAV